MEGGAAFSGRDQSAGRNSRLVVDFFFDQLYKLKFSQRRVCVRACLCRGSGPACLKMHRLRRLPLQVTAMKDLCGSYENLNSAIILVFAAV